MTKTLLIKDCDPGIDDAISLLLAMASFDEIDLLGVTTVVGNRSVDQIQENARRICELAGRPDMKVFRGCSRIFFPKNSAEKFPYPRADILGETALAACNLPTPTMPLQAQHAVSFIIETLLNSSQKVTLSPTGSLTNIACALIMEPRIKEKIEKIVLMGGVIGVGNMTPAAEYNFHSDPHAAYVVFTSGVPIVMIGLDATRQTQVSQNWLQTIVAMGTAVSNTVVNMLSSYPRSDDALESGLEGGILHDANVVAYLIKPDLYKGRDVYVEIDVSSTIMAGRSTVDWHGKLGIKPNAYVINQVDVAGFFDLLTERLHRYGQMAKGASCSRS